MQAESDDEQQFFDCKSNFNNDDEINEMQKLEDPILSEKIWTNDNILELLNELIFRDLEML